MIKVFGISIGGLQRRLVMLVISILIVAFVLFASTTAYLGSILTGVIEETRQEQEQAISTSSKKTMTNVLKETFVSTNALQASIADNDFLEIVHNVSTLQTMAEGVLTNPGSLTPIEVRPPDPSADGTTTVMGLGEEGVDITQSENLKMVANLSGPMTAMVDNSEKISRCYIGLEDGTHLAVDTMASDKIDEDGNPIPFPVRQRPWYRGAAEKGDIYFTGVIEDAYSGLYCVTCSAPVYADGQLAGVVGIDIFLENMQDFIESPNSEGIVFILNDKGQIILSSEEEGIFSASLEEVAPDLRENENTGLAGLARKALVMQTELTLIKLDDRVYYMSGTPMPTVGWAVISVIDREITEQPEKQLLKDYDKINQGSRTRFRKEVAGTLRRAAVVLLLTVLLCCGAAIAAARRIVRPIEEMTRDIRKAGQSGQIFEMKDAYRTDDEIQILAEAFEDQSRKTRQYIQDITQITREKERVSTELQMANRIQNSMLPNVFPPFPGRREFDIYASMEPAREVGGDFYDFFLIDPDHLCMVMADVSGKGIPAALFMMISKVILQSCAMLGKSAGDILVKTNEAICSSNQEDMFVTVWTGILEISTGTITAANAGHEYPAVMKDGKFSLLRDKHGLVIGGMQGIKYREYTITLEPGDKLFLYTDGIPEASDSDYKMFGTQKMLDALNQDTKAAPKQILANVKAAVEDFVQGAEQFDDMTMLCLEYKGPDSE